MSHMTELFLDDHLIEMAASVTRKIHRPRKHLLSPVIRSEKWWEGNQLLPYATLYDEEEKVFKMWCRCGSDFRQAYVGGHAAYSLYYTSEDGIHWERPLLGAMDFGGRRDHNVVFAGDETENLKPQGKKGFILSVIRHPHPKDETEKYVGLGFTLRKRGAYLGTSPDGIHWQFADEPFWQTPMDPSSWGDDNLMQMIYDKAKRKWVMYRRVIPQESERMMARPGDEKWQAVDRYFRVWSYADSDDLKDWGNYRIILSMDADDPTDTEAYNFSCYNYEQVYLGYLCVYHMAPETDTLDVQLTTSRNGTDFTRVCRREVWIPSGELGSFDYMVMPGYQAEPIIVNDKVYLYYEGVNYPHDAHPEKLTHEGTFVGLVTFDRDRFIGMETGVPGPCRLVTKPFVVPYANLFLNAATWGNGSIRAEVLTRDWQPIAGFGERESSTTRGNDLSHPVYWKDNPGLGRLVGKEVRLKFCMEDARIHAMSLDENDRKRAKVWTPGVTVSPNQDVRRGRGAEQGEV